MTILKCKPLRFNVGPQVRYAAALVRMVQQMTAQTEREIKRLFKHHQMPDGSTMAGDASIASQGRILVNELDRTFASLFGRKAPDLASGMIDQTLKTSATVLRQSVADVDKSGGLAIKLTKTPKELQEILKAAVHENVALIKSIQVQYHEGVRQALMRSITSGEGYAAISDHLQDVNGKTVRRAQLIADDQTRKVFAHANRARMKAAKMDGYIWRHSGGSQTPRPMHEDLDGEKCSLENPPVIDDDGTTGNPGDLINCHCFMQPYIDLDDED